MIILIRFWVSIISSTSNHKRSMIWYMVHVYPRDKQQNIYTSYRSRPLPRYLNPQSRQRLCGPESIKTSLRSLYGIFGALNRSYPQHRLYHSGKYISQASLRHIFATFKLTQLPTYLCINHTCSTELFYPLSYLLTYLDTMYCTPST